MSKNKDNQIIALNGGKVEKDFEDKATLIVEGEKYELESFILSGENLDGRRVLFTWNASLDELCSYNTVLNVVITEKVRDALSH